MDPKARIGVLPGPVAQLKATMAEITPDAVKDTDYQLRNKAFQALRGHLQAVHPAKYNEFVSLDIAGKQAWMARFMIVPEEGGCHATERTEVQKKDTDALKYKWMTEKQVEDVVGAKVLKDALDGCEPEQHTNPGLAAKGKRVYRYYFKEGSPKASTIKSTAVDGTSQLTQDEYEHVRDAMVASTPGQPSTVTTTPPSGPAGGGGAAKARGTKKRKLDGTPLEPKEVTPLEAAKKVALGELTTLKTLHAKMMKDLAEAKVIELNLSTKSWGGEALKWAQMKTKEQTDAAEGLLALWAKLQSQLSDANMIEECTPIADTAKTEQTAVQNAFQVYKTTVLGEFAKKGGNFSGEK